MNEPLVSVVMITYGHEKYIQQAIESVLEQQCNFAFELIIANDCSPDNTNKVVEAIQKKHPKSNLIRYHNHIKNLGMMPNFIWSLQQVKGTYIAICEGDDYWNDSLKLQKQVDFFREKPEIVFCFHGAKTIDQNLNFNTYLKSPLFKDRMIVPKEEFISKGAAYFCTASVMLKTKLILNLPNYFTNCFVGDFPLALLAISNGEIGYLEDQMAVYRIMADNSWSVCKDKDMIFKEKKYENTMKTLEDFDHLTQYQFAFMLKNLNSLCSYQLLCSYFNIMKSIKNRFIKYKIYGGNLNREHRVKILLKLVMK